MLRTYCIPIFLTTFTATIAEMEEFIVGGDFTEIEKYPQSVFMIVKCQTDKMPMMLKCGGSILNQRLIVTAAHCIARCRSRTTIAIYVGNKNRQLAFIISADGYIIHEDYDPIENFADIALIRMSKPLKLGPRVNRVAILKSPPYKERAFLSGWGMVDEENEIFDNNLKEIEQTVYSRKECLNILDGRLPQGAFCARDIRKRGYAASGDSGSGLLVRGYILLGLVSCKTPDVPDVTIYTDIGYFYQWIVFNARRLYCNLDLD